MNHFFDIGANIGNTFDWFLMKTSDYDGYHIWCFEPSPRHMSALRQRCGEIMANNEHNWQITLCPFGLSDANEWLEIYESADTLGDSIFKGGTNRPFELMCATFDAGQFISLNTAGDDRVVLKIDTEGSEIKILDSILGFYVKSRIAKVLIEFHAITEDRMAAATARLDAEGIPWEKWIL